MLNECFLFFCERFLFCVANDSSFALRGCSRLRCMRLVRHVACVFPVMLHACFLLLCMFAPCFFVGVFCDVVGLLSVASRVRVHECVPVSMHASVRGHAL